MVWPVGGALFTLSANTWHQIRRLDTQGQRQTLYGFDAHRPLPALNQRNVRAVQLGRIRQGFLRHSTFLPERAQSKTESFGVTGSHVDNNPALRTIRPQTMHNTFW